MMNNKIEVGQKVWLIADSTTFYERVIESEITKIARVYYTVKMTNSDTVQFKINDNTMRAKGYYNSKLFILKIDLIT